MFEYAYGEDIQVRDTNSEEEEDDSDEIEDKNAMADDLDQFMGKQYKR